MLFFPPVFNIILAALAVPEITNAGTITGGGKIGVSQNVTGLTYTGDGVTITYSWRRNGIEVGTGSAYTPVGAGDGASLVRRTIVTNAAGSDFEDTPAVTITYVAPTVSNVTVAPTSGTTGTTLTVSYTLGGGFATPAFQWERDNVVISGATSSTFLTTTAGTHTCVVSATNSGGSASLESAGVVITAPALGPTVVGVSSIHNSTGATLVDYQMALPAGAAVGDDVFFAQEKASTLEPTVPAYATRLGTAAIPRLNSTVGSNYIVAGWKYRLQAADITNNYVVIPEILTVNVGGLILVRNGGTGTICSVTASTGFNRSTGINANTINFQSETTTAANSLALTFVFSGGGPRTTASLDAAWTERINAPGAIVGAGRFVLRAYTSPRPTVGATPSDTLTVTGAADLAFTTFTVIVPPA